ncbi:MAG: Rrf2 family transcriptional regulator [Clostridiales bacterium]|nr:Rrf2 family transcriptional regulator [Clostridiales bacterium]
MKISTKGRYGLRLMLDLSLQEKEVFVPLKEIAARQQLPEKYLEQIITPLNRAGFLKGARGAQGGYQLTKDPKEYTVGMILRTMEGDLSVVSTVDVQKDTGDISAALAINEVWEKMNASIASVVDHITLEDLVNNYYTHHQSGK